MKGCLIGETWRVNGSRIIDQLIRKLQAVDGGSCYYITITVQYSCGLFATRSDLQFTYSPHFIYVAPFSVRLATSHTPDTRLGPGFPHTCARCGEGLFITVDGWIPLQQRLSRADAPLFLVLPWLAS